jgi:hypothetical protein
MGKNQKNIFFHFGEIGGKTIVKFFLISSQTIFIQKIINFCILTTYKNTIIHELFKFMIFFNFK